MVSYDKKALYHTTEVDALVRQLKSKAVNKQLAKKLE